MSCQPSFDLERSSLNREFGRHTVKEVRSPGSRIRDKADESVSASFEFAGKKHALPSFDSGDSSHQFPLRRPGVARLEGGDGVLDRNARCKLHDDELMCLTAMVDDFDRVKARFNSL